MKFADRAMAAALGKLFAWATQHRKVEINPARRDVQAQAAASEREGLDRRRGQGDCGRPATSSASRSVRWSKLLPISGAAARRDQPACGGPNSTTTSRS